MTDKEKKQAVSDGTAEAFGCWLYDKSVTTPDCVELGVKQAFAEWLRNNELSIMKMLKEVAKDTLEELRT